jgi:cyclophilin family peptidyl-prolyl cis-trans isomerase/HEAT repeat protein
MLLRYFILYLVFFTKYLVFGQFTPEIKKIIQYGYERKTSLIIPYLSDNQETNRYYAVLQCVSLSDPQTIEPLKKLLKDTSLRVACTAAYSLGQFPSDTKDLNLLNMAVQEKKDTLSYLLWISAGKYKETHQPLFYTILDTLKNPIRLEGALQSLFYLGMQGIYDEKGIQKAISCLSHEKKTVRYITSKYLERMPASYYKNDVKKTVFQQAQKETDTYTKIALLHALGKCLPDDSIQKYLNMVCTEEKTEYRYVVAALRAGGIPPKKPVLQNESIQQEILNIVLNKNIPDSNSYFKTFKASLANAINSYFVLKTKSPYMALPLLRYMGKSVRNHSIIASEMLNEQNLPVLRTTSAELLLQLRQDALFYTLQQDTNLFFNYCKQGLQSQDAGVIAIMSEMASKFYSDKIDVALLEQAKTHLSLPRDIETVQEIEKLIAQKKGKNYISQKYPQKYYANIDWTSLSTTRPVVEFKTNKGSFKLELFADLAPATVAYFLTLIKNKYYEGRYFHRLVPNFVIQGGCPRGDGYGSTDVLIRSEFSSLKYEEGTLGMASAGKDTESCQFFITHIPTPHLNGRYTIFGKVVSGMNVVHSLSIGDKISKTELKK